MKKKKLYWAKVRPGAIIPTKKEEDAGYDLYACIEKNILIKPHQTVMLPTGIATSFSKSYIMILKERGSTGTKGIAQRSGVIDSGYRDEIFIPITNTTEHDIVIDKNDGLYIDKSNTLHYPVSKAIAQAILLRLPEVETEEISYGVLKLMKSERGTGKLGSSGK